MPLRPRLAAAGLALALAACRAPAPPVPARNLVVITIDTLRADRLGAYGNGDGLTPNLDRIAREGALCTDASVHAPLTRPSHVSIFTGLHPAEHGIRDNVSPALDEGIPTLAETLQAAGFRTAAFVSSIVVSRQSGLARGFSTYSDRFDLGEDDARFLNTLQERGDGPTAEAVQWIESQAGARFFVWLHLYDPHDPYEPPEPFASRHADQPYDGEVAFSDSLVGRLDDVLARLGRRADTLLVVTSDHGEGLGEHGESVHGYFVYESTLAVPLVLRGPGIVAGLRLPHTVRSVDLAPTLVDLLGVPRLEKGPAFSGRSLAAALRGAASPPPPIATYAESLTPLLHFGWSDLRAIRDGRWKYIEAPRPELYDLKDDARETKNLVAQEAARAEALRAALASRLAAERATARTPSSSAAIPPELLEQLGALGYVGAGGPAVGDAPGADPKDKLEDYKVVSGLMREGLTELHAKDYSGAAGRFRALLGRGIRSFEVHYYLARALSSQKRPKDAVAHYEAAIERLPAYGAAYVGLSECHLALGDPRAALEVLRRGQAKAPRDARLYESEGQVLRALEKPREAIAAYERARSLLPKDALVRVKLGEMYRDAREPERAAAVMREAIALDPEPAEYWNALGMVLGGNARLAEGEAAFREAVKREPTEAQYVYNLGLILVRQRRPAEAAPLFRKALELDPKFTPARDRLAELR